MQAVSTPHVPEPLQRQCDTPLSGRRIQWLRNVALAAQSKEGTITNRGTLIPDVPQIRFNGPRVMMPQRDNALLRFERRCSKKEPESPRRTTYQNQKAPPVFHSHKAMNQEQLRNCDAFRNEIERCVEACEEADQVRDTDNGHPKHVSRQKESKTNET